MAKSTWKRTLLYGSNAFLFTLFVLGIVIVSYSIISQHHWKVDLTRNKRYSLSDQTLKVLKNLKNKVKITSFYKEDNSWKRKQVEDLLRLYAQRSPLIKFEMLDPDRKPSITAKYGIKEDGTTVLEVNGQRKDIYDRDLFSYSYSPYAREPQFKGEEVFTSALYELTQEEKKIIYFLRGHGERNIDSQEREGYGEIKEDLLRENYQVEKLDLVEKERVPTNCSLLIIAGPAKPLLEKEVEMIDDYLRKGGKILCLLDPFQSTGLGKWLQKWGVEVGQNLVIDPGRFYPFDMSVPIPVYKGHRITEELMSQEIYTVFPTVRSIGIGKNGGEGVEIEVLLESSEKGWGETNLQSQKWKYDQGKDLLGPVPLAVAVSKKLKDQKELRMVVYGDSDFAANKNIFLIGNKDLFLNTVNWLAKEESKISIRPRTVELTHLQLTNKQTLLIYYTSLFILPGLVLLCGGIVWWRRRHR